MNYYDEIKSELINNEMYKKIKDYSKNKSDLNTYYNVGQLLYEAGKQYGKGIIKEYSRKLSIDLNKNYSTRTLYNMRLYFEKICCNEKLQPVAAILTWSHYCELLKINHSEKILYYINICIQLNLSKRQLIEKIKSNEYERLDNKTKIKLINQEELEINDFVKNPIIINNSTKHEIISEKILKQLILEDISSFMKELGNGFCFIDSEYKIKLDDRYNFIDLLLFNYIFNCFVVLELKVTELKKEHIGQIGMYMNYIDKNVKSIFHNNTIGIIIVKKENKFVLEYSSDKRIYETTYELN